MLVSSEKDRLFGQLLDLIDRELLRRGKRPEKVYEVVYYKDKIPEDHGDKIYIITAIPEPDPPPSELKKDDT